MIIYPMVQVDASAIGPNLDKDQTKSDVSKGLHSFALQTVPTNNFLRIKWIRFISGF
jgi:hypothetical protein